MDTTTRYIKQFLLLTGILAGLSVSAFSQKPPPPPEKNGPPTEKKWTPPAAPAAKPFPLPLPGEGEDSEKSVAADARVNISMCVITGNVKVNGWDRSEVRVFVKEGSGITLNVREKDKKSGQPVLVAVTGFSTPPGKQKEPVPSDCIWGNEIEIDAPHDSALIFKGQEAKVSIDSIRKAIVKNLGGNILLRNIGEGITATTYQGDITVSDSRGPANLDNSSGNIIAFNLEPGDVGDLFKAKTTSGKIFLQDIEHRQVEAGSISGAISFNGRILSGGQYGFSTSNGIIGVTIPSDSSFMVKASYGFGNFNPDFPLKILTENDVGGVQVITAKAGTGDALVNITTTSGSIKIKKQ